MKNSYYEYCRRKMKLEKKDWKLTDGIRIYHEYSHKKPDDLSWWDDVGFYMNDYKVVVWWRHPRMDYKDTIQNMAFDAFPREDDFDFFSGSTKNYLKVGKSRKRIVSYTCAPQSESRIEWYDKINALEKELLVSSQVIIRPSFKVEQLDWCKGINFVMPVEVRNEKELKEMAMLAKAILKGQTTLYAEVGAYFYNCSDWNRESERIHAQ